MPIFGIVAAALVALAASIAIVALLPPNLWAGRKRWGIRSPGDALHAWRERSRLRDENVARFMEGAERRALLSPKN